MPLTSYETMTKFRNNLRRLMEIYGLNQVELAQKSGVEQSLISKHLSGHPDVQTPSLKTLIALAHALHCSLEDLVGQDILSAPDKKLLTTPVNQIEIGEKGKKLIEGYRMLSDADKEKIAELVELYAERAARKSDSQNKEETGQKDK